MAIKCYETYNFESSFLSCEKDQETIWKKLFIDSGPYSNKLKKLLVINAPDCLDETQTQYNDVIEEMTLKKLKDNEYIRVVPKFELGDHEQVKSYILLSFDDFTTNITNEYYRDCMISFVIISNLDEWELEDYKLRPHQIAGYIDGILNNSRLSGIGTLQFMGATEVNLNENLAGIVLCYSATHGVDDIENNYIS